jgi:hypothetical protein
MEKNPEGYYYKGQWLFYCDVCGKKMLSGEARRRWDGLYTCHNDWEPRHPSDFIRARKETSNQLPWSRPNLPEISVAPPYINVYVWSSDGLTSDQPYQGSGAFYFYDPPKSIYAAPEAYIYEDYL